MDHNELYNHLSIEKDLVTGFFIFFSRFEYSLKRAEGYASGDENGINANWDKFAIDHNDAFNSDRSKELKEAVTYLRSKPPMKQVLKNRTLDWKNVAPENIPLLKQLLGSIRRVRNNLFHGGKFAEGPVREPGRDKKLLESCSIVLDECLNLNENIRNDFYKKEI